MQGQKSDNENDGDKNCKTLLRKSIMTNRSIYTYMLSMLVTNKDQDFYRLKYANVDVPKE
uniref:Uncharacterized protein n=1 Tax=Romanomermis culicivorax TaxID=13658 RepID=A0A915JBT3_ROMCU